jgi:hypothetical protein
LEEIKTGLLAIPVLCGSLSYIITESFGWKRRLDKKFQQAKVFYIIAGIFLILGLFINYVKILPIKALLWFAILYGFTPLFNYYYSSYS